MHKIRVLHLIKSLNRGGAETLLVEGLAVSDRDRFDLSYAYFHPHINALAPVLADHGVPVTCISADRASRMVLQVPRVARYLREHQIDLLHCHLPVAGVVGRLAGRLTGTPVIYTEHNKVEWYRKTTFRLNAATYNLQQHAVAVSHSVKDSIDRYINPQIPVTVVHNGINPDHFQRQAAPTPNLKRMIGLPPNAPVIGNIASFIVQKRLDLWAEAAGIIAREIPDAHFVLLGEGALEDDMKRWFAAQGIQDRVHMPGSVADVRPYLAAMDVYMMSSDYEGLPVALMEAMAMRCAPVCTAVGGIPELLHNGENGYTTQSRDPQALAARVLDLLKHPERMTDFAEAARKTVLARFDVRRMTAELESLYLDVVEGNDRHEGSERRHLRRTPTSQTRVVSRVTGDGAVLNAGEPTP